MEVNIDSKVIQDAVVKAITDSTIGDAIKEAIQKALTEEKSYNSGTIVENACKTEVNRIVTVLIREELETRKEKIREIVTPLISDEVLLEMSSVAIEVMTGTLKTRNF